MSIYSGRVNTVPWLMGWVILALLPGLVMQVYWFGRVVMQTIILAVLAALFAEAIVLWLRGRSILAGWGDLSAVVTGLLLALSLPPALPAWMPVLGAGLAIIFGKQLYGGLGQNIFNPAMVGYAALLVAYPQLMSSWPPLVDAVTTATPLEGTRTQWHLLQTGYTGIPYRMPSLLHNSGLWINSAFLVGGVGLLALRVITWHIPVGLLGALGVVALVGQGLGGQGSLWLHWFSGGTMLAAFFIATDPVTASTTPRGKLYYAIAIGLLIYILRRWGAYPDGIAFAILLANLIVPILDHYTQPRVYGHR